MKALKERAVVRRAQQIPDRAGGGKERLLEGSDGWATMGRMIRDSPSRRSGHMEQQGFSG